MGSDETRVFAWRPGLRAAAVALQLVAAGNLCLLAPALLLSEPPLGAVVRRIFLFSGLPALALLVLRALAAAGARVDGDKLVLTFAASGAAIELPVASIARLRRFRVPLPDHGFHLELQSGRFELALSAPDPSPLAARLEGDGSPGARGGAVGDPGIDFSDAAAKVRLRWLHHPLLKFGLGGGPLLFVLFRLHQVITYGGLLGEWQQFGARRWLQTLAGVCLYVLARLLSWAAVLRALVEVLALWRSSAWRVALEIAAAAAFYGAAAAVLIARLFLS